MGIEIERKFLLKSDAWRAQVLRFQRMQQAYLGGTHCSMRVRIAGVSAFLNIKSRELGVKRQEFEYPLPLADAQSLLLLAEAPGIDKIRHYVNIERYVFEIDEFLGDNAGLIVAELELDDEHANYPKPDWLGVEVTDDARYYNSNLVNSPYSSWK
jgi:adenylate cyclase